MITFIKKLLFYSSNKSKPPTMIGNPDASRNAIVYSSKRRNSFERASFGKYDIPFWQRKSFKIIVLIPIFLCVAWLVYESIQGVKLFQS